MTHGVWRGGRGVVSLDVHTNKQRVSLTIDSPGVYRGPRAGGSGLATVRERLALAFGADGALEISAVPHDAQRTRVAVSFPLMAATGER
jgi:LytS/YehU family sensor histidine kinase